MGQDMGSIPLREKQEHELAVGLHLNDRPISWMAYKGKKLVSP